MKNILLIGTGGCGGKLVTTAMDIVNSTLGLVNKFEYVYINNNPGELDTLTYYVEDETGIVTPGHGTGKIRSDGDASVRQGENQILRFLEKKLPKYDKVCIISSSGGGYGSGSIVALATLIKTLKNDILVEACAAMPSRLEDSDELKNALEYYLDLQYLMLKDKSKLPDPKYMVAIDENTALARAIDSFIFIDNNKMKNSISLTKELEAALNHKITTNQIVNVYDDDDFDDDDFDDNIITSNTKVDDSTNKHDFNVLAMALYIKALDLHGVSLDTSDTHRISKIPGYKVILPIEAGCSSLAEAIKKAVEKSPFVIPNCFERNDVNSLIKCKGMAAIFNEQVYDDECWKSIFDEPIKKEVSYSSLDDLNNFGDSCAYLSNLDGFILLTGMPKPKGYITSLNEDYQEALKRDSYKNVDDDDEIMTFDSIANQEREYSSINKVIFSNDIKSSTQTATSASFKDRKKSISEMRAQLLKLKKR